MNLETELDLATLVPIPGVEKATVLDILANVCDLSEHIEAFKANLEKVTYTIFFADPERFKYKPDGVLQFRLYAKGIERPLIVSIYSDHAERMDALQKIFVDKTLGPGGFGYDAIMENFRRNYFGSEGGLARKYSDLMDKSKNLILSVLIGIITPDELKENNVEIKKDGVYVNGAPSSILSNPLPPIIQDKLLKNMIVLTNIFTHFTHRTVAGKLGPLQFYSALATIGYVIQSNDNLIRLILRKKAFDRRRHALATYDDAEAAWTGGGGASSSRRARAKRHRKSTRKVRRTQRRQ